MTSAVDRRACPLNGDVDRRRHPFRNRLGAECRWDAGKRGDNNAVPRESD